MCSSQVWTCHFDHDTRTLSKDPAQRAKLPLPKAAKKPTVKAALENLQKALRGGSGEQESTQQLVPAESSRLNAAGRMCQVEGARHSRTTTTLSFIDGHVGRAFVNMRNNDMSADKVRHLNHEMRSVAGLVFQSKILCVYIHVYSCCCLYTLYDTLC